jgi:UDP-N-acetylmuramyl pentapeptide synthase
VGRYAKQKGVALLLALGSATPDAVKAFGRGAEHFDDVEKLTRKKIEANTILVKGSRFMRMERVVAELTGEKAMAR